MKNTFKKQMAALIAVLTVTASGSCITANAASETASAENVYELAYPKIKPLRDKQLIFNTKYGYMLDKKAMVCYDSSLTKVVNLLHPGLVYHFSAFYEKGNMILGKYGNGYVILAENNILNCSLVFRASFINVPIKASPSSESKTVAYVIKGNSISFNMGPSLSGSYAYVSQLKGWVDLNRMTHVDNPNERIIRPIIYKMLSEEEKDEALCIIAK